MYSGKVLEIDLNNLTPQSLDQIDSQVEKIVNQFENPDTGDANQRNRTNLLLSGNTQKQEGLRKIFGRESFGNLLNFGKNPLNFIQGNVTRLIPFIGTALLVTGVISDFVKRVDDFQKEFVDNVDGRIDLFRSKEQQAQTQAGLQQLIITSAAGSAEPRDAYNTFEVFNTDQQRIENDFKVRDTSGVD
ncbi:MAG: hypothetical protein GKS07_06055 [Nitrosopumilus sp.]|nr:MAG: hypothetical protein GKS07_06055 [Nitrosopumilus sp.]